MHTCIISVYMALYHIITCYVSTKLYLRTAPLLSSMIISISLAVSISIIWISTTIVNTIVPADNLPKQHIH